jgi:hypothetical protein
MYTCRHLILTLGVLVLAACAPLPHTSEVAPQVSGLVYDAQSGTPVAGAEISYTFANYHDRTTTGDSGRFAIGPLLQWHYLVCIGSPGHYPGPAWIEHGFTVPSLKVAADGYQPATASVPRRAQEQKGPDQEITQPRHDSAGERQLKVVIDKRE